MSTLNPISSNSLLSASSLDALANAGTNPAEASLASAENLVDATASPSESFATTFYGPDGNTLGSADGQVYSPSLLLAGKGDANQGGLPSTPDNTFKNINDGYLGTRIGREYGKEAFLVNDRDGHRAYANIVLTKESNNDVLRVSGKSEAIEHVQDGRSPARVIVQEFIVIRGNNDTSYTYQAEGSIGAGEGGVGGTAGKSWTQVQAGDIKSISVEDKSKVTHDVDGTIVIPNDAQSVEYKLNVTFVYDDGSRVSRSVSAKTDI